MGRDLKRSELVLMVKVLEFFEMLTDMKDLSSNVSLRSEFKFGLSVMLSSFYSLSVLLI